jgi:hypothetical protein
MQLQNQTPVSALLWRTSLKDDRIAAAVIARMTYRIVEGRLLLDPEQPWIVSQEPWQSPAGELQPDDCFRRGGVDVLVIGSARAPGGQPTPRVEVRVALGEFVGGVDVYGERVWRRGFTGELVATDPVPFVARPLTLEFAYGGKQLWDQLEVPFPSNSAGKGFYLDEAAAIEQPLPNIEDPRRPIQRVGDQPDPVGVGFCPLGFGPTLRRSVEFTKTGHIDKLHATLWNQAFPDMIAPAVAEGTRCSLFGVHEQGTIGFRIPKLPLLADIQIGETRVERLLAIEQIGVEPDLGRVFITYRFPFRYKIVRMQPRACVLRWSPGAAEG